MCGLPFATPCGFAPRFAWPGGVAGVAGVAGVVGFGVGCAGAAGVAGVARFRFRGDAWPRPCECVCGCTLPACTVGAAGAGADAATGGGDVGCAGGGVGGVGLGAGFVGAGFAGVGVVGREVARPGPRATAVRFGIGTTGAGAVGCLPIWKVTACFRGRTPAGATVNGTTRSPCAGTASGNDGAASRTVSARSQN